MRQIKFRGRFWNKDGHDDAECEHRDGDFIFGGYARMKLDAEDGYVDYIINEFGKAYRIYPESLAQLVGVDSNGNEVYEGDMVERIADYDDEDFDRAKAFPMAATFDDFSAINDGQIILVEVQL